MSSLSPGSLTLKEKHILSLWMELRSLMELHTRLLPLRPWCSRHSLVTFLLASRGAVRIPGQIPASSEAWSAGA